MQIVGARFDRPHLAHLGDDAGEHLLLDPFTVNHCTHLTFVAHDLIRKPVPTFRDHALALSNISSVSAPIFSRPRDCNCPVSPSIGMPSSASMPVAPIFFS